MKSYRWAVILFLTFSTLSCTMARTYSLYLKYQPNRDFPSLQQKIGSTLGIVPFEDERSDTSNIGIHIPFQGVSSVFKSDPFPLEKAIQESLIKVLSSQGVKTIPISSWDGNPDSLKNLGTDSVLTVEIRNFWIEGRGVLLRTDLKISIHFVIHLGVKKEAKVFTKNVSAEKEMAVFSLSPEKVEQTVNGILSDIFDSFFSDPY